MKAHKTSFHPRRRLLWFRNLKLEVRGRITHFHRRVTWKRGRLPIQICTPLRFWITHRCKITPELRSSFVSIPLWLYLFFYGGVFRVVRTYLAAATLNTPLLLWWTWQWQNMVLCSIYSYFPTSLNRFTSFRYFFLRLRPINVRIGYFCCLGSRLSWIHSTFPTVLFFLAQYI